MRTGVSRQLNEVNTGFLSVCLLPPSTDLEKFGSKWLELKKFFSLNLIPHLSFMLAGRLALVN